ncbi:MAG: NAD(+)/NADH kinase [Candidatus Brocadiia bacterium]
MTRIILTGDGSKPAIAAAVSELLPLLRRRGEVAVVDLAMDRDLEKVEADLAVILGGDGAILSATRRLGRNQVPAIGINLGKFGFLAEVSAAEFREHFEDILAGRYRVSRRMMLACRLERDGRLLGQYLALNDVVVSRGALSRLVRIALAIDGHQATTYNGDGVIVSTPTGSTAHSLSAGGPVMEPSLEAMVVTPICPHTLTNRPLVLPGTVEVALRTEATPVDVGLTLDGQVYQELAEGDRVTIRRAPQTFQLVDLGLRTYYDTLREKLNWRGSTDYRRRRD